MYAAVAVRHMFTGKAYSRAVRGRLLSESAILSLFLQKFWNALSHEKQNHLIEIYESDDPNKFENADISFKLMTWFQENVEMSLQASRTAALRLS